MSDATLSYLESSPDKQCRWMQLTPPGEPRTVVTLPADCFRLSLAWRPDGRQALVTHRQGNKHEIWQVDLETGTYTVFSSLPSRGVFRGIGFDVQGRPVAVMHERYVEGEDTPSRAIDIVETVTGEETRRQLLFEGQVLDMAEEGEPVLIHFFRQEKDGTWKRFRTKSTCYDAMECTGIREDAHAEPIFHEPPGSAREALGDVPQDAPDFAALSAVREPVDPGSWKGSWKQLETAAGPLYLYHWEEYGNGGDPAPSPGLVRIRGDGGLVEPEGLSFRGPLSATRRGDLVLLGSVGDSRLWNAKTKKLVASLNGKLAVFFWPKPLSTPAAVAGPPAEAPVRTLPPEEQLAAAFRAVYGPGSERPPTLTRKETTHVLSPVALEWSGDTAVLLTLAKLPESCDVCDVTLGIHYLAPDGAGFAMKGSWPLWADVSAYAGAEIEWKIRRDFGRNPFLTSKGSWLHKGYICEWVTLTELAPGGPLPRGKAFTGYDNEGAGLMDGVTRWKGTIARPVPDRSFDVVVETGGESFTEHYRRRGEEYRGTGASQFKGKCQ